MTVRVEWTRYGPAAAGALRAAIASAKGDEPLAPVTVVVPANHVGVAARRGLASGAFGPACGRGHGVAAVTFVTPYRLAELLGAASLAATGRRPVSTPVIAAAMRAALAADPGVFGPVAEHAATEAALVVAYRELRDLTPRALDALAGTGRRARDVVRLHRATRAALEPAWYDEEDLMTAAASALASAGAARDLGAVVVHLPQRLSRHAATLLSAVGRVTDLHVLAGATGDHNADREVVTALHLLGGDVPAPQRADPLDVVDAERTRLVTTSDADDEVRAAVRAIVDATRAGTPLERVAVLSATPQPYTRLVHEQLEAAGIPVNGAAVVPVAGRMAGRALLQLLQLPETGFRRQDVFAWLSAAPILFHDRWAPVSAWERLSRDAAVVAGRADWDARLATLAEKRDERGADAERDPDAAPSSTDRYRRDAQQARELRDFALGLIDDLDAAAAGPRPWGDHARWARTLVHRLLGDGARRERDDERHRKWPEPERRAAERVELALERLGALDAVEGPVGLDVFTRTLALELESDLGRTGRFGTGVLVGSVGMGVGLDLDLVVVVGLAEGTFPSPVRDDSLLPDHERAAAGGELPLARDRTERQHRELLAALASAGRQVLGVPRGDLRRSSELMPSRWALDVASKLAGERWWSRRLLDADDGWVRHVPSFDAGLRRLASPATDQEYRLRALLAAGPGAGRAASCALGDPVLAHGTEVVAARRSDAFTRFDGNLAGLAIPSPVDHVTSPTRLERWAVCPFDYLLRHVLGVEPVENPEEELRITALDRGSLVHAALEGFVLEVLDRPAGERPEPGEPWSARDRARLRTIAEELCREYEAAGLTGRPIFWRRDRAEILADLERFLDADDEERRLRGSRPIAAELAFGLDDAPVPAVLLRLPDGRVVRFRGKADRIDLDASGTVRIIDYKTGRAKPYDGLSADDPDQRGEHLQLVVYGAAARAHHGHDGVRVYAEYWFVSKRGEFRRIGYDVTPEVLERVGSTLGTMIGGIEAGVFPHHPDAASSRPREYVTCVACDPDALGVTEMRAEWERKRADPALARYADLAEPLLDAEAEVEDVHGG